MHIQKVTNISFNGSENKERKILKGLAISAGVGAAAPLFCLMDGESFKEVKKDLSLKKCGKYAVVGAAVYSGYKAIDTFVKSDNKKTEEKIKTGLFAIFGAVSFPLIIKSLCNKLKNVNNQPFFKTTNGKITLVLSSVVGLILPFVKTKKFD